MPPNTGGQYRGAWYKPQAPAPSAMGQANYSPFGDDAGFESSRQINAAGALGYFDPMGSPALKAQRRRGAVRNARNRRRRGQNAASLYGLDANQTRAGLFGLDRENSGMLADTLNEGDLQEGLGNRDWSRSLFSGQLDFERQRAMAKYQAELEKKNQPSFWGNLAGQAAGMLVGPNNIGSQYLRGGGK